VTVDFKDITKEQFQEYEGVRSRGRTNMFDLRNVEMLSGLDRNTILAIMQHYEALSVKYPGVRKYIE